MEPLLQLFFQQVVDQPLPPYPVHSVKTHRHHEDVKMTFAGSVVPGMARMAGAVIHDLQFKGLQALCQFSGDPLLHALGHAPS